MRRFAFWFSVSVIASLILFYIWEMLRSLADVDVTPREKPLVEPYGLDRLTVYVGNGRVRMTPEQARRLGFI